MRLEWDEAENSGLSQLSPTQRALAQVEVGFAPRDCEGVCSAGIGKVGAGVVVGVHDHQGVCGSDSKKKACRHGGKSVSHGQGGAASTEARD